MEKVFFDGTHRCRAPDQTLAAIIPLLPEYGITRLADVTGLDTLGIPVVMAVRPPAASLTVAQGKGATLDAARASAAMEAIETFHGEFAVPPATCIAQPAELRLGYQIADLTDFPGNLVTEHTVLKWIPAVTTSGTSTMVPRELVRIGRQSAAEWECHMLTASSNGLAGGNTRAEAAAHALFELIERDAVADLAAPPPGQLVSLDMDTVPGRPAEMVARIRAGGGHLQVVPLASRFAVPCFAAYLRVEDSPWAAAGAGAHSDPEVALSRAVTEACQSRLTIIAGSRDDLSPKLYRHAGEPAPPPFPESHRAGWTEATAGLGWICHTDEEEVTEATRRITAETGMEPLIVDLAARREFSVVKVLAPGLGFRPEHDLPWPGTDAA